LTIVPAIGTFSTISNIWAAIPSSPVDGLMRVIASFFALGHTIHLLPQSTAFKSTLWGFWLIPILSFVANEAMIERASISYLSYSASGEDHPIESLVRDAKSRFARLLESQSKTYAEAHQEYIRRYGMTPPPGFDHWFEFANNHQSPLIDDFDVIHKTLTPFYNISGHEVVRLMQSARDAPGNELWYCTLNPEKSKSECLHPHRNFDRHISESFDRLLSNKQARIPPVQLLVTIWMNQQY
jgi:hypothetical protein